MYELIACVQRAPENAGNLKPVLEFLISRVIFFYVREIIRDVDFLVQSISGID